MAACGSLQHMFDPENPAIRESISPWHQIITMKPVNDSCFIELFGELHFGDNNNNHDNRNRNHTNHVESSALFPLPEPSPSSSLSSLFSEAYNIERLNKDKNDVSNKNPTPTPSCYTSSQATQFTDSDCFSTMNSSSDSLSVCTEGIGFESSDDVDELLRNDNRLEERRSITRHRYRRESYSMHRRSRVSRRSYPPPISCIGLDGKPWVSFRSYRQDGRFILQEIRFPTQEFLHASREDGRLKMHLVQSDDEMFEEEEDKEEVEDAEDVKKAAEGREPDDDDDDDEHEENADQQEEDDKCVNRQQQ